MDDGVQAQQDVAYDLRPQLAVVADGVDVQADATRIADRLGARLIGAFPLADAARHFDGAAGLFDAVLLEAGAGADDALDGLFDRLNQRALAGGPSVIRLPASLIDRAAARAAHADVALLVDADEETCLAALAGALARAAAPLRLAERDRPPAGLAQLSEEVSRIARTLAALSAQDQGEAGAAETEPTAATIRAAIRARRLRDQFFAAELFADPAWDMLLDLMAARLEGRHVAVSSLCIAAAVPPTTALRWMKQLTDDGTFVRVADPRDGRRVFIELSPDAAAGLTAYFRALARTGIVLP